MKLEAIINALPEAVASEDVQIDVSEFFGNDDEGKPIHFVYRDLNIAQMYQIFPDAAKLRKYYGEFPEGLRINIATLAIAHVSPPCNEVPAAIVYADLAKKSPKIFSALNKLFNRAFPDLNGAADAIEEEKKSSSEEKTKYGEFALTPSEDVPPANSLT